MAVVYPSLDGFCPVTAGQIRELDVVRQLVDGLADDYAVFHSVMWSSVRGRRQSFGEIDTIVLMPTGNLVLLEVKAGPVEFSDHGIGKRYQDKQKDVLGQLRMQYGALRQRLKEAGIRVQIAQLLVVPDVKVGGGTVLYPRQCIVDKEDFAWLAEKVRSAVPDGLPDSAQFGQVRNFLNNVMALAPDPTTRIGLLNATVTTLLTDGLATWGARVAAVNGRVLIRATAGSGKTQLAVRLLQEGAQAGVRAGYCCFNRPLADHLRALLPEANLQIGTFHEWAISAWREVHGAPDFAQKDVFEHASRVYCEQTRDDASLDVLVLDEAQDLAPAWIEALLRRVKPGGRVYALLDEDQQLYRHGEQGPAQVLAAAAEVRDWDNFRSPRRIVETINAFGLTEQPIIARCPLAGEAPGFHVWDESDPDGLWELERVLGALLDDGVSPEQIVLLSFAGRDRSALLKRDELGGLSLRRFSGRFSPDGTPQWSTGNVLAETLFRFKGQAIPLYTTHLT